MKINITKQDKIEAAIKTAQGKAKKRLLDYSDITTAIANAERKLTALGIAKKYWNDCILNILPEKVCNAYGHRADGTRCNIARFSSGWFVIDIYRDNCGTCAGGALPEHRLNLSEAAFEAIAKSCTI